MPHKEHFASDGRKLPSVTEVFQTELLEAISHPGLCEWYGRLGLKKALAVKDAAAKLGRNVHEGVEAYLTQVPLQLDLTAQEKTLVDCALQWVEESGFQVVKTEDGHTSEKMGYGGTFDAVGFFPSNPDCLCVIDWKTSGYQSSTWGMQIAAYAALYKEKFNVKDQLEAGIVWIRKNLKKPRAEFLPYSQIELHFDAFLNVLDTYNYLKREEKRIGG